MPVLPDAEGKSLRFELDWLNCHKWSLVMPCKIVRYERIN